LAPAKTDWQKPNNRYLHCGVNESCLE